MNAKVRISEVANPNTISGIFNQALINYHVKVLSVYEIFLNYETFIYMYLYVFICIYIHVIQTLFIRTGRCR